MKKRCILFPLLTFLLLCFLLIPYATNEEWIKKYNKEIYENNVFAAMGILQPCVASYNEGNVYYKMGSYKLAIKDYKKALKQYPTMKQRCDISTNLALAMVQDIDFEKVNKDNVEETKEKLEKAKDVLKKDGFATEDNTCSNPLSNRFTLCESRHVVKSTFREYREYMLNMFNENIVHHKEQIKRDREFIRDNKRRIKRIDSDLDKAIAILNANLEAEIKRNKK